MTPNKAWIQIESHLPTSDSNSRSISVAYEKDNHTFFNQHSNEYDELLNGSKPYECPTLK